MPEEWSSMMFLGGSIAHQHLYLRSRQHGDFSCLFSRQRQGQQVGRFATATSIDSFKTFCMAGPHSKVPWNQHFLWWKVWMSIWMCWIAGYCRIFQKMTRSLIKSSRLQLASIVVIWKERTKVDRHGFVQEQIERITIHCHASPGLILMVKVYIEKIYVYLIISPTSPGSSRRFQLAGVCYWRRTTVLLDPLWGPDHDYGFLHRVDVPCSGLTLGRSYAYPGCISYACLARKLEQT